MDSTLGPRGGPESTEARREQHWRGVVEEFVSVLSARGYSRFTLRDYRSDVLRLGLSLGVGPFDLRDEHLAAMDRAHVRLGLNVSLRRRRLSACHRFLEFLHERGRAPSRGPVLLAASAGLHPLERLLVCLVYFGGFRLVEIADLEGRDVRLRKGTITSRVGYRIVPLHPRLQREIDELRHHAPLAAYRPLLPGLNGFAANSRTLHSRFHRIVRRLGMAGLKPDDLRREVSADLVRRGAPPGLVKAFLGKDRGRPVAPRRGSFVDLTGMKALIHGIPDGEERRRTRPLRGDGRELAQRA